jgi:hypothetical protein
LDPIKYRAATAGKQPATVDFSVSWGVAQPGNTFYFRASEDLELQI